MPKVFVSTVINAPIERVWRVTSDFNGLPAWMPGMKDSAIEPGKKATEVGAVRKLGMAGPIGMSLVCEPKLLLVDELSLGLAPIVTEEIMGILHSINRQLGLAMLIVEQNAAAALRVASFGYVLEGGRVVFKGACAKLIEHQDIKEFYLGGAEGKTRSYRDLRQYARKRRWWG